MKARIMWTSILACACMVGAIAGWAGYAVAQPGPEGALPACEDLVEPLEPVCSDCTDADPWEESCECIDNPEGDDYCRNLPPRSECEYTKQPVSADVNTTVKEITVPCYRTYQCRADDPEAECGPSNVCRKSQTGQSDEDGTQYALEDGANCVYEPGPGVDP
jgi:hypothetical protein